MYEGKSDASRSPIARGLFFPLCIYMCVCTYNMVTGVGVHESIRVAAERVRGVSSRIASRRLAIPDKWLLVLFLC